MMGLLGLSFTGIESDKRHKLNGFKQWIAPLIINGVEIGQELQASSWMMEEEPAKDSSGKPRVETTPGSQVRILRDIESLQRNEVSTKENVVARVLEPDVGCDSGQEMLSYVKKKCSADSDFLNNNSIVNEIKEQLLCHPTFFL